MFFFWQLTHRFSGGGPRSQSTRKTRPRPFFRDAPGARQLCKYGNSRYPRKAVQGCFFGTPQEPPPGGCSVPQNFSLAALAGASRILSPPKSHPRPFVGTWLPMQRRQPGGVRCCKESRHSRHGETRC